MNKKMQKLPSSGKVKRRGVKRSAKKRETEPSKAPRPRAPATSHAPVEPGHAGDVPHSSQAPGPDADESDLRAWHRGVGLHLARLGYIAVLSTCHWCLSQEPLPYTDEKGGTRQYCQERCAKAARAFKDLHKVARGETGDVREATEIGEEAHL